MKKVVTFGEIMGRLSPPGYGRIIQAQSLNITYGGGEANVAGGLAHLGIPAKHVTRFPANELGKAAAKLFIETMHNNEDMNKVEQILKPKLFIRESSQKIISITSGKK